MGDLDTKPGEAAEKILKKTIKWSESFYNKDPDEIRAMIKKNESNGIIYIEYFYYQIGLDNDWLKEISTKIGDPLTVRREILLQRLHGSDLSPFPRDAVEYISGQIQTPIDELYVASYYRFDIYSPLKKNVPYLIGIDCSTGTGSDNNAITIVDPYTVRPVAEFASPYIGETDYMMLIRRLVKDYIPRAIVIIERNSVGDAIIDGLMRTDIAGRLYFDKDKDLVEQRMREAQTTESILAHKARLKSYYGVYTQGKSREDMMSILSRRINENKDDFITKNVITDISGLIRTSSGKIEARPGGHDDSIMSYLMAMYVYYHGNNLAAFGFFRTDIYDGSEQNEGLNRTHISMEELIPADELNAFQRNSEMEKELNYEDMLKEAIQKSREDTVRYSQSKAIKTDTYIQKTPDEILYGEDDTGGDLSLFDDLNMF